MFILLCPVRRVNVPFLAGYALTSFTHNASVVSSVFMVTVWKEDERLHHHHRHGHY